MGKGFSSLLNSAELRFRTFHSITQKNLVFFLQVSTFGEVCQARCPMCSLQNSNLHLAVDCKHREIQEAREDALQQMDTVMLDWHENDIPGSWAQAWPQLSRAQKLVALVRADLSPGNRHLWTLVCQTPWELLGSRWCLQ